MSTLVKYFSGEWKNFNVNNTDDFLNEIKNLNNDSRWKSRMKKTKNFLQHTLLYTDMPVSTFLIRGRSYITFLRNDFRARTFLQNLLFSLILVMIFCTATFEVLRTYQYFAVALLQFCPSYQYFALTLKSKKKVYL